MFNREYAKGIFLIICSCIAFSVMATLIRSVHEISSFKIAGSRFIIGALILSTLALLGKIQLTFKNHKLLFIRGTVGGIAVFLFYLSISKLGLGKGTVLGQAYPIFAAIFSYFILKEKLTSLKVFAIILSFLGIYLMQAKSTDDLMSITGFGIYEYLAVLGSILAGFVIVLIKKLHNSDSTYAIFFAQCVFGFWFVLLPSDTAVSHINFTSAVILLLIGLSATIAQLVMTQAYKYVPVTIGAVFGMLVPIFNLIIGLLIFNEYMSIYQIIGAVTIISGCIIVVLPNKIRT